MEIFAILNSQLSFVEHVSLLSIFALIFGSFASLLSHRLATKEPIAIARSKCTKCGVCLTMRNLIPLFSWLFQRGKCTQCGHKISVRYPLIELSFVVSFLTVYFALGMQINLKMILFCFIAGTLIVMSVVDLEHYFIPDSTQFFFLFLVVALRFLDDGIGGPLMHIKAAFAYVGFSLALLAFFYFLTKTQAIGIDDIKFFFIAGLFLGMDGFLLFMFLNGLLGALFGTVWQRVKKDSTFPFAPAICVAFFISMLFGKKINFVDVVGSLLF